MSRPTMDPTFYRTAADAAAAPREELAYVVAFDRAAEKNDAMTVVDVNPSSQSYGKVVGWTDVPALGDELHHFGWNACSSALKHEGHDMAGLARRLPAGAGAALVEHLRPRCRAGPPQPDPGQDDRRQDPVGEGRLLPSAHPALGAGRGVPDVSGRTGGQRRRPGRDRPSGPQHLRGRPRLGDRPRSAALRLRRLVAPESERADLQRVGQPVDDRERYRPGTAARAEVRPRHPLLGPLGGPPCAAGRSGCAAPDGTRGPPLPRP